MALLHDPQPGGITRDQYIEIMPFSSVQASYQDRKTRLQPPLRQTLGSCKKNDD